MRDTAVEAVVDQFKDHPYVRRAVARQKKSGVYIDTAHDDSMTAYLKEAGAYKLLTAEDEKELFGAIDKGVALFEQGVDLDNLSEEEEQTLLELTAARQKVYVSNLRLVVSVAKKRSKNIHNMPLLDVVHAGNEGLATAISRFDVDQGYKFSTFATWWIDQKSDRAYINEAKMVRLPVHMNIKYNKVKKAFHELEQELGYEPSIEEQAAHLGETPEEIAEIISHGNAHIKSLNERLDESKKDSYEFGDIIEDQESPGTDKDQEAIASQIEIEQMLDNANLKDSYKFVLGLRFGLPASYMGDLSIPTENGELTYEEALASAGENKEGTSMTLEEVGSLLGVTRERIRQLQISALEQIRKSNS